jgi:hypothetical protein
LFDITVSLCERFPAYTPTAIRQTPVREVFLMVRRLNEYNGRRGKQEKSPKKGGKIRRPAGDNWF